MAPIGVLIIEVSLNTVAMVLVILYVPSQLVCSR